jgi:tight adherence protein C
MNLDKFLESAFTFKQLSPATIALISGGTFFAVSVVVYWLGKMLLGVGRNELPDPNAIGSRRPLVLGGLTEGLAFVIPLSLKRQETLRSEMQKAGYYHRKAFIEFLAVRNLAMILWLVFVGLLAIASADPKEDLPPKMIVMAFVVMAFIYGVPRVVLSSQAENRCRRIKHSLPDSLDMITMMVTGGLPLRDAIQRVARELHRIYPDIACELRMVEVQTDTGSLELALRQFSKRLDIPDVTALASLVQQTERIGGQVAGAFREFADSIRRTRRQQAEERGNTASIKLLFPVVFFLAPPIYVLLLGPAVVEMKNFMQNQGRPGGALSQDPGATLRMAQQAQRARANGGNTGDATGPEAPSLSSDTPASAGGSPPTERR